MPIEQSQPLAPGKRWTFLDAIRGLAALAVVIQHIIWYHAPAVEDFFSNIWSPGRFGVIAFFIVSGFIVPRSLEQKGSVKDFWIGRFFRLYPAYWFSLVLIFLLALIGYGDKAGLIVWIANITMLQEFVRIYDLNVVTWTLGLEILLYASITVAYMCGFLKRTWLIAGLLLFLLGGSSIVLPVFLHIRFPAGAMAVFGSIIAGMALYRWFTNKLKLLDCVLITGLCLATTIVASVVNYGSAHVVGVNTQPNQVCAILSAVTAYGFFIGMLALRNLTFPKWILWLGQVSYSLYLLHPVAGLLINHKGNPFLKEGLLFLLSFLFAWIGYTIIEVPSNNLAKRILAKQR